MLLSRATNLDDISLCSCNLEKLETVPEAIASLLHEYGDVIQEPKSLPPARSVFYRRIQLKENSDPINQRPYHYFSAQKAIIERLIDDMLAQGFIQRCNSPYASPMAMVGKKDGNWHFCVDNRKLNDQIVKNWFPIPLTDDLLDDKGLFKT